MKPFAMAIKRFSGYMNVFAGVVLFSMMLLTSTDVFLRLFKGGLLGTYELVAVAGAMVAACALPLTSWQRGHVCVDFLVEHRSPLVKKSIFVLTRIMGIILFAAVSVSLYIKGADLYKSGEVSLTLHIAFYPACFLIAFCMFMQCLVLIIDILKTFSAEVRDE